MILAVALCVVLLTLAVPLQQYVAQRGQLSGLAAQERAARARVAALEQAQAQWRDPAYITQQARERLHFVRPGETAYVIVGAAPAPAKVPSVSAEAQTPAATSGAWYGALWSTMQTAGKQPTKPAPAQRQPTPQPLGPSSQPH